MKQVLVGLLTSVWTTALSAHSPVLNVNEFAMTRESPFEIEEPEHSKAIFSTLDGSPHIYRIEISETFDFYVGITAPKNESCGLKRAFSFDILNSDFKKIDGKEGSNFEWWAWYEEWEKMVLGWSRNRERL
jgi:hypothetical protein